MEQMMGYKEFHRRSIEEPEAFWGELAGMIDWHRPFDRVLDYSNPPFVKWFVGGETNLCYNAIDRHLAARADQPALIYVSTETNREKTYTYRELHVEVQRMAAVFQSLGLAKGDRILIYMPMIPEAIFAMLAAVRLGAIHSVVFGGFAAHSLATRIDDARPKLMIIADAGIRAGKVTAYKAMVDESLRLSTAPPEKVIVVNPRVGSGLLPGGRARPGLRDVARRAHGRAGAVRVRGIRPPSSSLYVGNDGKAQGRAAGYRRIRGGAGGVDEVHLRRAAGGDLLRHVRHRVGGGALLHYLWAADLRHGDGGV